VAVFSGVIQVISASSTAADNTATVNGFGRLAYTITYRQSILAIWTRYSTFSLAS
jgi:hypothetical protein